MSCGAALALLLAAQLHDVGAVLSEQHGAVTGPTVIVLQQGQGEQRIDLGTRPVHTCAFHALA